MSRIIKFKIEEVVEITRTRIVDVEVNQMESELLTTKTEYNLDKGKEYELPLHILTELIRKQHSKEGDMTEQVIKATRL